MYPILHPYGSLVYQAGRGDVHTVLVDGVVHKHDHKMIGVDLAAAKDAVRQTVDYARSTMGEDEWRNSITPELPDAQRIPNPYTYTEFGGSDDRHTARMEGSQAEPV
jgi:hypothetical protein